MDVQPHVHTVVYVLGLEIGLNFHLSTQTTD